MRLIATVTRKRRRTELRRLAEAPARDLLVSEVPAVLRADLYAVAALAGAVVVVIGRALGFATGVVSIAGAALCIGLRIMAMHRHWQLPRARSSDGPETDHRAPTS